MGGRIRSERAKRNKAEYQRKWVAANRDKRRAASLRWFYNNREKQYAKYRTDAHKAYRRIYHRRWKYGLTQEEYDALLAAQDQRCAMLDCRTLHPGGPSNQWHVDHDHETGEVRGLLCADCNLRLGAYEFYKSRHEFFERYLKGERQSQHLKLP